MFKAFLLDLDGTLCRMDRARFEKEYFTDMALYIQDMLDPEQFLAQLPRSIAFMLEHPSARYSCMAVFCRHCASMFGLDEKLFSDRLLSFYVNELPKYRHLVTPIARGKEFVALAERIEVSGEKVRIASNAVMPQIGIIHRLHWAELETDAFDFISGADVMHYTKPNPGFYQEIASALAVNPQECIMVGNGKEEDLAAWDVGMSTYFMDGEPNEKATWFGTIEDLIHLLSELK